MSIRLKYKLTGYARDGGDEEMFKGRRRGSGHIGMDRQLN